MKKFETEHLENTDLYANDQEHLVLKLPLEKHAPPRDCRILPIALEASVFHVLADRARKEGKTSRVLADELIREGLAKDEKSVPSRLLHKEPLPFAF